MELDHGFSVNSVNNVNEELAESLFCVGGIKDVEENYVMQENIRSTKESESGTGKCEGSTIKYKV